LGYFLNYEDAVKMAEGKGPRESSGTIAKRIDHRTAPQVAVYLGRMMEECRNLALHEAVQRDPGLSKVKALETLLTEANS
jgi:hypothetical protein